MQKHWGERSSIGSQKQSFTGVIQNMYSYKFSHISPENACVKKWTPPFEKFLRAPFL